jgi:phage minor structural protein, N-terminal domain protein|uniref:Tail protein n=1 Tax=Siphoviridae sp. ctFSL3 TaxID=2825404 RepID=A0A8S5PE28_9CAUD|nr:MAG TPA: tail protein [Siphoviridae sp. ctFSL3]
MIPILYKADATNFASYGIGALPDTISCEVTEERNGAYECVVKYPVTGMNYSEIKRERIIKAKPSDTGSPQAFRIYRVTTPINGIVKIYAQHISYDLVAIATPQWESTPITPQLAIEEVFDNALTPHRFTFQTDYTEAKAFAVSKPKSLRAVLGGEEGSVLSLWGGEFEWDNFQVIHHQGRGHNNGVVIEYGKNLTKFEHDSDISDVYTDLLPYAVTEDEEGNETVITLAEQILQIGKTTLSQRKTLIKDFTDSFDIDAVITEDLLREKAQKYLENNPLGIETPTLTISFEALWKQPEYAAVLERVALCDTVTVRHSELGISEHVKVIKTVYDTLAEKYVSITLGSAKASLLSTISDTTQSVDNITQKVDRFPSLMQSAINSATKLITGQKGGYVVLHGDNETGQPYELLILDSPNIEDAVNVWRWNVGGLGFSSNGYNGPYETAITADGQIVADFITSGSLVANIIKAGVLSSQDGSSYWNLETGEVVLRAYAMTETVEETNSRIDVIEEQKMLRLVITSTNGNIFKNGNIQTTLEATVFSWDENITDTLDPNQFIWTRVSDDAAADAEWNAKHFGGTKSIEITKEDVKVRATFFCDLIDTTTRNSLLG